MAGDWIKMRTNLDTDPAVVRIASGLQMDRFAVVGRLHRIWAWANEHLTDGQDVPVDGEFLDALVAAPGFSDQLRRVNWLSGRDNCLNFPNFERHNGSSAKERALDAHRKREARKSANDPAKGAPRGTAKGPDANRTKGGPEERRGDKRRSTQTHSPAWMPEKFSNDPAFLAVWEKWKVHRDQKLKPLASIEEEQQLMRLDDFDASEAVAIVQFTLQQGAVNLITNGDHNVRPSPSKAAGKSRVAAMEF